MVHGLVLVMATGHAAASMAAPTKSPPFRWEDVGFTADCDPNPALERALSILTGPVATNQIDREFDESLYTAVSGEVSRELFLDEPQPWHGLKLTGVKLYTGVERGPINYYLYFAEDAERVRSVWNNMGWKLPSITETREVIEDYAFIGVQARDNGGSLVACWRD